MKVEPIHEKKLKSVIIELTADEAKQISNYLGIKYGVPEHLFLFRQALHKAIYD